MIMAGFWVLGASLWMDIDYMGATLERISTRSMAFHVDFDSFWRSARAMLEGQSIYDTGVDLVNLNPPLWTVLISPLGLLEPITAYRVFVLVSLAMVVSYLAWTVEELRLRPGWTVVGAVLLLFSSPCVPVAARKAEVEGALGRAHLRGGGHAPWGRRTRVWGDTGLHRGFEGATGQRLLG